MHREEPGVVVVAAARGASRYAELAAGTFAQFQGRLLQTSPDSLTGSFDQAEPAVRAAREFLRRAGPEAAAIGIDAAADTAAALAHRAAPGQILVSRAVSDRLVLVQDLHCTWVQEGVFRLVTEYAVSAAAALEPVTLVPEASPTLSGVSAATPVATALAARYEILGEAGRGGMGVVYKARDRETGEILAVKVIKPDILADSAVLERFKNELRLAHRITHRNVCRIHEFNRSGQFAYITMEFVEGESLRELMKRGGAMVPQAGLGVARQICSALREAHREGVVHRDLKPENVMIDRSGTVKVMDFGVARSMEAAGTTLTGLMVGTPAYMAPEQASGKPVDQRTDIYALGLTLYEMFTGVPAVQGQTVAEVVLKQIQGTPTAPRSVVPSLAASLESAILRCLEKDPAGRFQSAEECDAALAVEAAGTPAAVRASGRSPMLWAAVALAGLLAAGGIVYIAVTRDSAPAPAAEPVISPAPAPPARPAASPPQGQPPAQPVQPAADTQKARISGDLAQAAKALEQGRYDEAIRLYQSVLKLDPNHARAKEGLRRAQSAKAAESDLLKNR